MVTDSADGPTLSASIHEKPLMQYLPPAGSNSSTIVAVWVFYGWLKKHSPAQLEEVCAKALTYSSKPSYKSIQNLFTVMKDSKSDPVSEETSSEKARPAGMTRGAHYYGGR